MAFSKSLKSRNSGSERPNEQLFKPSKENGARVSFYNKWDTLGKPQLSLAHFWPNHQKQNGPTAKVFLGLRLNFGYQRVVPFGYLPGITAQDITQQIAAIYHGSKNPPGAGPRVPRQKQRSPQVGLARDSLPINWIGKKKKVSKLFVAIALKWTKSPKSH